MLSTQTTTTTTSTNTVYHVLPKLSKRQKTKIEAQLQRYISINDDALPKITWKWQNQGSETQLSFLYEKPQQQESLRQLIRKNKFNHTEHKMIQMFIRLCKTVQKMHKMGVPHQGITADHVFPSGQIIKLPPPIFHSVQKAKKQISKQQYSQTKCMPATYESIDVFHLALILVEMLTKYASDCKTIDYGKIIKVIKTIQIHHLGVLLEGMVWMKQKINVSDVLRIIQKMQIKSKIQIERYKEESIRHLSLFSFFSTVQTIYNTLQKPNTSSQTVQKEWQNYWINIIKLKNSNTILFQLSSKNSKVTAKHAYHVDNFTTKVKGFFKDINSLFTELKKEATIVGISETGELTMTFKFQQEHVSSHQLRNTSSTKQNKQLFQNQSFVEYLVNDLLEKRNNNMKEQLKSLQEVIGQSRCLPQTSKILLQIKQIWSKSLLAVLRSENLQDLLTAISICDKYWLESDEGMNKLKKKVTQFIESGMWQFLW